LKEAGASFRAMSAVFLILVLLAAFPRSSVALDSSPVAATAVAGGPYSLVYDQGQGKVFVADGDNSTVSVISDSSNSVVAVLNLGGKWDTYGGSQQLAYDPSRGEILTLNGLKSNDPPVGYPASPATVISDSNYSALVSFGAPATGAVVYDASADSYFITNPGGNSVYMLRATTLSSSNPVSSVTSVGSNPTYLAYDSGKSEIFVVDEGIAPNNAPLENGNVTVISDTSNGGHNQVVSTIDVGGALQGGIVYDPGIGEVFVPAGSGASTGLTVISDASNQIVARIDLNTIITGVAYDSGRHEILAVGRAGNSTYSYGVIVAISDTNNSVLWTRSIGGACIGACYGGYKGPAAVVYDSTKGESFVANNYDDSVYVVSDPALPATTSSTETGTSSNSGYTEGTATSAASTAPSAVPPVTISVFNTGGTSQGSQPQFPIAYVLAAIAAVTIVAVAFVTRRRRRQSPQPEEESVAPTEESPPSS
jgi:hypothetical protein